jgi:aspartate aminotransferase-like enzyme
MVSHRSQEYREVHSRLVANAKRLLGSEEALVVTGSGTAGIEACVSSSLAGGELALVAHNGIFGERLRDAWAFYGARVMEASSAYGDGLSLERVKAAIDGGKPEVFAMVLNETSTGVANRAREICLYAKAAGAFVMVDGVSGIGGMEFSLKGFGADLCVVGSQKCIGAPPGIALVGASAEALSRFGRVKARTRYLDLGKYVEFNRKGETPVTPAVSLVFAMDEALSELFAEGTEKRFARHRKAGELLRKSLSDSGFALLAEPGFESPTLSAFRVSPEEDKLVRGGLKEKFGIVISGGMGSMKGAVLRVGHMGNFRMEDIERCASAIAGLKRASGGA